MNGAVQRAMQRRQISIDPPQFVQRPTYWKEDFEAGTRRLQPARRALKEPPAAAIFEHLERGADGRLAQPEEVGDRLHVVGFAEFDEQL